MLCRVIVLGSFIMTAGVLGQDVGKETKSALESDPKGWLDITPPSNLAGWKRVAIPPGSKLAEKNPWSL
jgi:hypothetical protein